MSKSVPKDNHASDEIWMMLLCWFCVQSAVITGHLLCAILQPLTNSPSVHIYVCFILYIPTVRIYLSTDAIRENDGKTFKVNSWCELL